MEGLVLQDLKGLGDLLHPKGPLGGEEDVQGAPVPLCSLAAEEALPLHPGEDDAEGAGLHMAGLGDGLLAGTVVVPEVIQHLGLAQGEASALQPVQQLLLQAEMGGHQEIMNGFVHRNTSKH